MLFRSEQDASLTHVKSEGEDQKRQGTELEEDDCSGEPAAGGVVWCWRRSGRTSGAWATYMYDNV